jgi:hypothetical protein
VPQWQGRRHVVRDGRVLVVAAHALVRGDPFTLVEDLDGARGHTGLDLGTGEAVGDTVEVVFDLDVVVDADTTDAPFGEHVRCVRKTFERWPVGLFEELASRHAKAPDRPLLV